MLNLLVKMEVWSNSDRLKYAEKGNTTDKYLCTYHEILK